MIEEAAAASCTCSTEPHTTNPVMLAIHERTLAVARLTWPEAYALYPPPEGCPAHPGECGHRWFSPESKRKVWFRPRLRPAGREHHCIRRGPHERHSCCCGARLDVHG